MSILADLLPVLGSAAVATAAAAALSQLMRPLVVEQRHRREKARARFKDQVQRKLQAGIALEAHEISDIGRGLGISSTRSVEALYELYSEAEDQKQHDYFKSLLEEIHRAEPFEALPEEVRPSLARLSLLCQDTSLSSDKELLHPITKALSEYQEMRRDHASIKKQSRVSYIVALVSFFIGIVGLILAFSGPSKEFIAEELKKSTAAISEKVDSANRSQSSPQPTLSQ